MSETSFTCQRCGHCCQGEGGIVMTGRDRNRLARHLGMDIPAMLDHCAETVSGKTRLRAGDDGYCIFFRHGQGCGVHQGRPDICRAWPYFRGNLLDASSWEMIQSDCPGVNAEAGHALFVREGVQYLQEHGLLHEAGPEAPHALVLCESLLRSKDT
ncbi:MAG: YkgJ family cysteine cluster protein [Humidesulfovibrio sp.]|uniref:YkgJ family cysteine cluster protein n=1 Tax=Humidesulfovibrio sp. TaxID=2910988 RepID=UPI0027F5A84C|nr:YkgJ family cysteine cluster protein [Humidesulfovibrio sp.]MDQ7835930.1 YkgJ family cysteine cluster protein [Humidesulfovibrio sp.]